MAERPPGKSGGCFRPGENSRGPRRARRQRRHASGLVPARGRRGFGPDRPAILLATGSFTIVLLLHPHRRDRAAHRLHLVADRRGTPPGDGPAGDAGHRHRLRLAVLPSSPCSTRWSSAGRPASTAPSSPRSARGVIGAGGGAQHAIVGTLVITGVAALISVPIGIMAAVYLNEYGTGRLRKALTFFVDVMTGIPSIVAGLFAYALFAAFLGPGHPPRHHRVGRPVGPDDPDRDPLRGGDPEDRPRSPPRGGLCAGDPEVEGRDANRAAHRAGRACHGRHARRSPA